MPSPLASLSNKSRTERSRRGNSREPLVGSLLLPPPPRFRLFATIHAPGSYWLVPRKPHFPFRDRSCCFGSWRLSAWRVSEAPAGCLRTADVQLSAGSPMEVKFRLVFIRQIWVWAESRHLFSVLNLFHVRNRTSTANEKHTEYTRSYYRLSGEWLQCTLPLAWWLGLKSRVMLLSGLTLFHCSNSLNEMGSSEIKGLDRLRGLSSPTCGFRSRCARFAVTSL